MDCPRLFFQNKLKKAKRGENFTSDWIVKRFDKDAREDLVSLPKDSLGKLTDGDRKLQIYLGHVDISVYARKSFPKWVPYLRENNSLLPTASLVSKTCLLWFPVESRTEVVLLN